MADYHPLIARAVAGLDKNTGEHRRALYERARTALVAQLRGVVPALDESEITRERLALEEAIRKIEGEAARRAREEARSPLSRRAEATPRREAQPPSPRDQPPNPPAAAAPRSPGQRRSLSEEALKGFRDGVTDPQAAPPRNERASYAERPRPAERGNVARSPAPESYALEDYGETAPRGPPEELLGTPLEPPPANRADARARTS